MDEKRMRTGIHPGTEICDVAGHRDLSDSEGGVGEIPALSFGVSEVEAAIGGGGAGLPAEQQTAEGPGSPATGGREQEAQRGCAQSILDHL